MRIVFAAVAIATRSHRPIRQPQYPFTVGHLMGKHSFPSLKSTESGDGQGDESQSPPFLEPPGPDLPHKLQGKLDLSRSRGRRGDLTGARNPNAISIENDIATAPAAHRRIEIAVIKSVKNFHSELRV